MSAHISEATRQEALEVWSALVEQRENSNTSDDDQIDRLAKAIADAREQGIREAAQVAQVYEQGACSIDCNLLEASILALIEGGLTAAMKTMSGDA